MQQLPVLPLGKSAIDRNAISRSNPNLIPDLLASSATRVLVLRGDEVRILVDAPGLQLRLDRPDRLGILLADRAQDVFYLGQTTAESIDFDGSALPIGTSITAIALDPQADAPEGQWHSMRRVNSALTDLDAGIFSQLHCIRVMSVWVFKRRGGQAFWHIFQITQRALFIDHDPKRIVLIDRKFDGVAHCSGGW